jgi:hypothetical protein
MHIGCTTTSTTYNIPYLLHEISPHFHDHNSRSLVQYSCPSRRVSNQVFDPPLGHHQDTQPTQPTHHEVAHPPSSSDAQVFFFLPQFFRTSGSLVYLILVFYCQLANIATFGSQFSCSLGMGGYLNGSYSE